MVRDDLAGLAALVAIAGIALWAAPAPTPPPAPVIAPAASAPSAAVPRKPGDEAAARPKREPRREAKRQPAKRALPSCAAVRRAYESMTWAQKLAAHSRASAAEVAHGRRCLGL